MLYHQIFCNSLANGLGCTGNWVGCMEIDPKEAMLKIYNPAQNSTPKKKE
jgi:hypothetical protein